MNLKGGKYSRKAMPSTNNADELIRSIYNFTSKTEIDL